MKCVSVCDCTPWRWPAVGSGDTASVHFSCLINGLHKPGAYASEDALYTALEAPAGGTPCARYYYLLWYAELTKALGGPLAAPAGRPPPLVNMTTLMTRPTSPYVPVLWQHNV